MVRRGQAQLPHCHTGLLQAASAWPAGLDRDVDVGCFSSKAGQRLADRAPIVFQLRAP